MKLVQRSSFIPGVPCEHRIGSRAARNDDRGVGRHVVVIPNEEGDVAGLPIVLALRRREPTLTQAVMEQVRHRPGTTVVRAVVVLAVTRDLPWVGPEPGIESARVDDLLLLHVSSEKTKAYEVRTVVVESVIVRRDFELR